MQGNKTPKDFSTTITAVTTTIRTTKCGTSSNSKVTDSLACKILLKTLYSTCAKVYLYAWTMEGEGLVRL